MSLQTNSKQKLTPLATSVAEVYAPGEEFDDAPLALDLAALAAVPVIVAATAASVPVTATVNAIAIAIDLASMVGAVALEGTVVAVAEVRSAPAIPHSLKHGSRS